MPEKFNLSLFDDIDKNLSCVDYIYSILLFNRKNNPRIIFNRHTYFVNTIARLNFIHYGKILLTQSGNAYLQSFIELNDIDCYDERLNAFLPEIREDYTEHIYTFENTNEGILVSGIWLFGLFGDDRKVAWDINKGDAVFTSKIVSLKKQSRLLTLRYILDMLEKYYIPNYYRDKVLMNRYIKKYS